MNERLDPQASRPSNDPLQRDVAAIQRIDVVPIVMEVICRTTGMGFAAVARVTEQRWVACAVRDEIKFGLVPGGELKVGTTICAEIRDSGLPVVIDHVAADAIYRDHATPRLYGFQSYISMPIRRKDGSFFGTLCAIDPKPAKLQAPEVVGMFKLFAELIGLHLDAQDQLAHSEAALRGEQQTSDLREQFIAVLGHDLRNPLASIAAGTNMLAKNPVDEKARTILGLMRKSVYRMGELIDNVLDLARSRLGDGLQAERKPDGELVPALEQVIAELRALWPDRTIDVNLDIKGTVDCDRARIAQLLSNLLANALAHGGDTAVSVSAANRDGQFVLSVANGGAAIPEEAMRHLFEPYFRASPDAAKQGLGLGLFISSQIARAHNGTLTVTSDGGRTCFTLTVPQSAD